MSDASSPPVRGDYGPDSELVDFIHGITFEIWERRGVELIRQYYAPDCVVFGLDGIVRGAEAMVDNTHAYLRAFPDRLLLADDVIWSGDRAQGFYSSHRIQSPMTNLGPSMFGPATGKAVRATAIADCVVERGVITREWLIRDALALVRQLGFEPLAAARRVAERRDSALHEWLQSELARPADDADYEHSLAALAHAILAACWQADAAAEPQALYAPYAVLHRSPVERHSGAAAIAAHFAGLRAAFADTCVHVDHVAAQPWGQTGTSMAVRWSLTARHSGDYAGLAATNRRVFILGVSHWRLLANRVVVDWTLFDGLGVLAQLI